MIASKMVGKDVPLSIKLEVVEILAVLIVVVGSGVLVGTTVVGAINKVGEGDGN